MKTFEVHLDGHSTIAVTACNAREAQDKVRNMLSVDFGMQLHWDIEVAEAEDITKEDEE